MKVTGTRLLMAATVAFASVGLMLPMVSSAASGRAIRYTDTGHDPVDVPIGSVCCPAVDIRSSTRTVWVDGQGRRWLSVSFGVYDRLFD